MMKIILRIKPKNPLPNQSCELKSESAGLKWAFTEFNELQTGYDDVAKEEARISEAEETLKKDKEKVVQDAEALCKRRVELGKVYTAVGEQLEKGAVDVAIELTRKAQEKA